MKLMVIVLNEVKLLDDLLVHLGNNGINGGTILSSTGMAQELICEHEEEATRFLGSLRKLLTPTRQENKTLLIVLTNEQVVLAKAAVAQVLGDLTKPNTGILFTIPIDDFVGGMLVGH